MPQACTVVIVWKFSFYENMFWKLNITNCWNRCWLTDHAAMWQRQRPTAVALRISEHFLQLSIYIFLTGLYASFTLHGFLNSVVALQVMLVNNSPQYTCLSLSVSLTRSNDRLTSRSAATYTFISGSKHPTHSVRQRRARKERYEQIDEGDSFYIDLYVSVCHAKYTYMLNKYS